MYKKYIIIILLLLLVIVSSCENPITGYGPQPTFIDEHKHIPRLNAFGVLRPDSLYSYPLSYVHLEGSYAVTSQYPDSFIIADADITLFEYEDELVCDSIDFIYTNFDIHHLKKEYRIAGFYPQAGNTYGISCTKEGFPVLTAKTTIPAIPEIIEDSMEIENGKLSFILQRDSLAGLYDIYFWIDQKQFYKRVIRPEKGAIKINLEFTRNSVNQGFLAIFAYDLNLAKYLTSTFSIKPNTYQPPYSVVENGYGCFGSLNVLQKTIIINNESTLKTGVCHSDTCLFRRRIPPPAIALTRFMGVLPPINRSQNDRKYLFRLDSTIETFYSP